jgi:hypothetical protein
VRLHLFDADGTLWERDTGVLLPGVKVMCDYLLGVHNSGPGKMAFAICSNQGGVGLRLDMEHGNWGDNPQTLPVPGATVQRYEGLARMLFGSTSICPVYLAFRYINSKGRPFYAPPHPVNPLRWQPEWRKPAPGMLLHAMTQANVDPASTLFIGDSAEDSEAARNAGVAFVHRDTFFGSKAQ